MLSRRVIALILLGLCVIAAGVFILVRHNSGESPKAPLRATVVEWNMSGWSQNKGSTAPADVLFQEVARRSPPPQVIVTTETCSSQFDYLRQKLTAAPYGYQADANWSIPAFSQPNCASYGNSIFWLGKTSAGSPEKFTYPPETQANGAGTQEQRNLLCVAFTTPKTSTTAATPLRVCGTHLHQKPEIAAKQFAVARARIDADNRSGPPTLLVGDLNMIPGQPAFNDWYDTGQYTEADLGGRARSRPTTTSNVKLDYGFVPSASMAITQPAGIELLPQSSDHAIYTTYFAMKPAPTSH